MREHDEIRALRDDLRRRRNRRPHVKRIADVVNDLMARRGYAQILSSEDRRLVWQQAVGEVVARDTRPGNVRRGVLEVIVRHSLLVQELTFQKKRLLMKLSDATGDSTIRDLRFRVGVID